MGNKRPIGIFDSGVGGLTVAKAVMNLLPEEEIVYLGDTANLPYGEKSAEKVTEYAFANTHFLLKYDIKVLVVACNTASSVALESLQAHFDIPILGVIEPAARAALKMTRNKRLSVIGTNRTIKSDVYAKVLRRLNAEVEVFSKACPLFVPLIEENFIDHEATKLIAREYLEEFSQKDVDTLILGCTHYPLIRDVIAGILPRVNLVDSANATARNLRSILDNEGLRSLSGSGNHLFFATDLTAKLHALAKRILGNDVRFNEVKLSERSPEAVLE